MATLNEITRTMAIKTVSQHGKHSTRPVLTQANLLAMSPASLTDMQRELGGLVV